MNRRSIMVLLIGVIATLSALSAATFVARSRCREAEGAWDAATRSCRVAAETLGYPVTAVLFGAVTGIVVAVLLHRAVLFVTGRATRRELR